MLKISSLQSTTSTQSRNCLKSVLSILPLPHKVENVKKSLLSRPPHPDKVLKVKN